jgi:tRNA threonylcarbamoyladenosine biosynthesis protein TsaE
MKDKSYFLCTNGPEGTFVLGRQLGSFFRGVICLEGDLGSGKTVLAQGIAKGFGIKGYVTSPTFTIINTYEEEDLVLYHMDAYRIENADMLYDTGFYDILEPPGITVIEWADRIKEEIRAPGLWITINKIHAGDKRIIAIKGREDAINLLGDRL